MATGKPPPVSMPHTIPSFAKIHEFPFAPAFFGNASGKKTVYRCPFMDERPRFSGCFSWYRKSHFALIFRKVKLSVAIKKQQE